MDEFTTALENADTITIDVGAASLMTYHKKDELVNTLLVHSVETIILDAYKQYVYILD